jgi:uncharacterized membrane protein (GlpM family)
MYPVCTRGASDFALNGPARTVPGEMAAEGLVTRPARGSDAPVIPERAVTVLLSVLVVVLVAVVQERSRQLAAIIATMPLTAPLAMWIVFSASRGDQRQTADFAGSMVIGSVASLVFVLACWLGLRQEWGFLVTLVLASTLWLLIVLVPRWFGHSPP